MTLAAIIEDCKDFQATNDELLEGIDDNRAGIDFWLTRNHQGAGFWDRGLGLIGEQLTKIANAYGERDLYLGDNGKLYL